MRTRAHTNTIEHESQRLSKAFVGFFVRPQSNLVTVEKAISAESNDLLCGPEGIGWADNC